MSNYTKLPSLVKAVGRTIPKFNYSNEGKWAGEFTFVQAADTQFGMDYVFNKRSPPVDWTWEVELAKSAVDQVNKIRPQPRFMIVCGDLVNAFPGEHDKKKQLSDFFKVFSELQPDIPLVCICGNHDIGDAPSAKNIKEFVNDFGDDYFSFWIGGVKFIVLNSQLYKNSSNCEELPVKQDEWLRDVLMDPENKAAKHLIAFQHIPWFVNSPKEEEDWYNLSVQHRDKYLKQLYEAGIRHVFCGHYHRNAGGIYGEDLHVVVTSAVGVQTGNSHHGFRLVHVKEGEVTHKYHSLKYVPKNPKE